MHLLFHQMGFLCLKENVCFLYLLDRTKNGPRAKSIFIYFFVHEPTTGAMIVLFCFNKSQSIPHLSANFKFSKSGHVIFWPVNENWTDPLMIG